MDQLAAGLTLNLDNKLLAELREHIADHSHVIEDSPVESQSVSTQEDSLNEKLDQLEKELDDVLPTYSATTDEVEEEASVELDDEAIMDADLAEIFLEEANELVNGINPALDKLKQQPGNEHVILQLQRDMHTLKGGARLAGFEAVGDLSDILEKLFEKLIDYKADASSLMLSLLEESSQALEAMLKSIQALQPCQPQDELVTNITSIVDDLRVNTPLVEEDIAPENEQPSESQTTSPSQVLLDLDPELAEIFLEEAQEIIDSSGELLHQWESDVFNIEVVGELQRELHTLKGGARMAEINPIGDLAHELETLF
ncbi:Hpt domain-containing protein, partial [Oleiphilus sp. HI0132]